MEKFNRNDFKVVIVDEAHHAVSPTYMRVFEHFGVLNDSFKVLLWGCTATPNQTDKISLEPIFGSPMMCAQCTPDSRDRQIIEPT